MHFLGYGQPVIDRDVKAVRGITAYPEFDREGGIGEGNVVYSLGRLGCAVEQQRVQGPDRCAAAEVDRGTVIKPVARSRAIGDRAAAHSCAGACNVRGGQR